ncbi:MAG: alpha/beta hydrolase [Nitrospirae bacterium]|nr:alpha/beta hydrolase [Nitrospirota bacterium]
MNLNETIHKGGADKPVAVLIHGLGVDKGIWTDPLHTKLLANNFRLKILAAETPIPRISTEKNNITIGDFPDKIENIWSVLRDEGYNLITWSQKRPVGHVDAAVVELKHIVAKAEELFPGSPVALIGHSRGGLIARKFMEDRHPAIKALITIASPHSGSSISKIAGYLSPLAAVLKKILPKEEQGTVIETIGRTTDFLLGEALKELMPGSDFIKGLKDSSNKNIKYLSFGGTEPRLLTVYQWKKNESEIYPKPLIEIPDSLMKLLPSSLKLDELTPGKGDALVSAESSVMPWSSSHYDVPANHVSIMWDKEVIQKTIEVLKSI